MSYIMNKMSEYRAGQERKLLSNTNFTIGDVTTVNMTMVKGGVQNNVVPPSIKLYYDCRITIGDSHNEFESMVHEYLHT